MSGYIYGIHEYGREWVSILGGEGKTGWVVTTHALGTNPTDNRGEDFRHMVASGVTVIARLNNGYYPVGTIPQPQDYDAFAARCRNFVAASNGCNIWIIGNEPNLKIERPYGAVITPEQYGECFIRCRNAIKQASAGAQVVLAPVGPYNAESGDWLDYWRRVQEYVAARGGCDGLGIHTYTRTNNPTDIVSTAKMAAEGYTDRYSGFLAYRQTMEAIIAAFRHLPVYLTEANPIAGWENANTGLVQAMYAEINRWNERPGTQKIRCLTLFRWPKYDDPWWIEGKQGVLDDFRMAVRENYTWAQTGGEPVTVPQPISSGPSAPPAPATKIDPRASARGVRVVPAQVAPGQGYWRAKAVQWLDTPEAIAVGPDHHILGEIVRDGRRVVDVPLLAMWPGNGQAPLKSKNNPGFRFNYDYGMSGSLTEFSIRVDDGNPSDTVEGIGMGKNGNPNEHTSTLVDWEWTVAVPGGPVMPLPTITPGARAVVPVLLHPVVEPTHRQVSQVFGVNAAYYSRFKVDGVPLLGHNGIDFATPIGSAVRAVAAGMVVESTEDAAGYGQYIKIAHPGWGESLYAHLSGRWRGVGDTVNAGDVIGLSGNTGISTGPHLHFGLRVAPFNRQDGWGGYLNPHAYLEGAMEGRPPHELPPAPRTLLIDPLVAAAIIDVESNNTAFGAGGKMTIRFEPHVFMERVLRGRFDTAFQVGSPAWRGEHHRFYDPSDGAWKAFHGSQVLEYRALEVARAIDPAAAAESTAMGLAQVMGFNARRIGYVSAEQMFTTLQRSLPAQMLALVNFILTDADLLAAVRQKDFNKVAELYNGSANVEEYGRRMREAYAKLIA